MVPRFPEDSRAYQSLTRHRSIMADSIFLEDPRALPIRLVACRTPAGLPCWVDLRLDLWCDVTDL